LQRGQSTALPHNAVPADTSSAASLEDIGEVSEQGSFVLAASRADVGKDAAREAGEGQGLHPDRAGPAKRGQEQPLAAEDCVLDPAGHLDVVIDGGLKGDEAAGVQPERLARGQLAAMDRPARVDAQTGKAKHHNLAGTPLPLRWIVSEVRNDRGKVAARWLLLTNLPGAVDAATVALGYYWRRRIESYHKRLKGAGQQIESWGQETAAALSRRLLVAAMSAVIVWRLARENSPQAEQMRDVPVRLSGRQMKRNKNVRPFTEPALLAGLGVLVTMLDLLQRYSIAELRRLAQATLPDLLNPPRPNPPRCDDG